MGFKDTLLEVKLPKKLKRIGPQLGTHSGGEHIDEKGRRFYVKHSASDDHAKNEVLASNLYRMVGSPCLDHQTITHKNGLSVMSTFLPDAEPFDKNNPDHVRMAQDQFATHAWLANWDAIGSTHDNQIHHDGHLKTVDTGGALLFRANGKPKGKLFNHHAHEWEVMRKPDAGPSGVIFSSMSDEDLTNSAKKLTKANDDKIHAAVMKHGPGDIESRKALAKTLIKRRDAILKKAGLIEDEEIKK